MVALSKHFKRSNLAQNVFEFHAWVKKCHFGNFSERAGMAMPCQFGPQKLIIAFEKFFLFWMPMNIQKDWKTKLESAYSFMLKFSKITVWIQTRRSLVNNHSSFQYQDQLVQRQSTHRVERQGYLAKFVGKEGEGSLLVTHLKSC